jgi:uncharacterized protein HemX
MTESTSTARVVSAKEVKYRGGKLAALAFILALAASGGVGYLYYNSINIHTDTVYQLQSQNRIYQNYMATNDAAIKDLNESIDGLKNKIESANTSNGKVNLTNYQVNELVSLANQSLLIYHDLKTTLKILNYVKNLIQGNNDATYVELKVALVDDIAKLERLTPIDYTIISAKLNNIINQIDTLKPVIHGDKVATAAVNNVLKPNKWQEFLNNIKTKLFGLVQLSTYTNDQRLELLPEQNFLLTQNLKLDILNARIALLQNDGKNWQYSLNAAKVKLSNYYILDSSLQQILSQISELVALEITISDANIDNVLKALTKLNNL